MARDYLQLALGKFNVGKPQWYGWKDLNSPMSYSNIKLNDDTATIPTEAEVNAKIQELKDADIVPEYVKLRKNEYPNHNDCIHALLDGGDTLTELQAKRQEVKSKFPKP